MFLKGFSTAAVGLPLGLWASARCSWSTHRSGGAAFMRASTCKTRGTPFVQAITGSWRDMLRVMCCSLINVIPVVTTIFGAAYAVQPGYSIGFCKLGP
ncbi:hypothetical protein J2X15_002681 [Rhodoferax saidenbachensis]|uniref:Uncharacterized protein n=1 Tax=Rhodoferax saidenbachensis TaxID=1484693 RepID=A0ABU1ZPB7_9BURK|nr:hypothetical protein [Rhodoferax saidenbachensis]